MNTIIRKALDEALTAQYNEELTSCDDEDYSFSVGFLKDMNDLIRKTDRKLIYYSKYIAVVACAVVAIGCAVLLPNLLRSDIKVDTTGTETAGTTITEITSDTTPESTTVPTIGDFTTTLPTETITEEVSETTPGVTEETEPIISAEITTEITTATETSPVIAETEPVEEDDEDSTVDGDIIVDDARDEEAEIEDDDDLDIDTDDDLAVDDDADYDSDNDLAVDDDADDNGNPNCGPEMDLVPVPGETFSEVLGYYFKDDVNADVLDELYITRATKNNTFMDPEYIDTGFLMDYLKAHRDAEHADDLSADDTNIGIVSITLSDVPKHTDRTFRDTSVRNRYDSIFGNADEEDDEDWIDEDSGTEVYIRIYPSGVISVVGTDIRNETAFFVADKALTDELMSELDSIAVTGDNYATVGDLMSAYGLTADGITQGYSDIRDIYDITVTNAHIDTSTEKAKLVSILNKHKNTKLVWKDHVAPNYSDVRIKIDIGLEKSKTVLSIRITENEIWFVGYIGEDWCAPIDNNGIKELINAILLSENLPEADFYTNAYDYITARADFSYLKTAIHTDVDNGKVVEYVLNDEKLCEELRVMISEAFKNTEYMPFDKTGMSRDIIIDMGDWCFGISETGRIRLGACNFRSSTELYNKILAFIKANVASVSEEDMDFEVEDDVEVSIDCEDGDIAVDD